MTATGNVESAALAPGPGGPRIRALGGRRTRLRRNAHHRRGTAQVRDSQGRPQILSVAHPAPPSAGPSRFDLDRLPDDVRTDRAGGLGSGTPRNGPGHIGRGADPGYRGPSGLTRRGDEQTTARSILRIGSRRPRSRDRLMRLLGVRQDQSTFRYPARMRSRSSGPSSLSASLVVLKNAARRSRRAGPSIVDATKVAESAAASTAARAESESTRAA